MDKISCNIIQDLIPLCIDGAASEDSMKCVEKHIETCDECRQLMDMMQKDIKIPDEKELRMKEAEGIKDMKKAIRNIILIAVSITLVLVVGGFSAVGISKNMKQRNNEENIVGTWKENGTEIISFDSNGIANISGDCFSDNTHLVPGKAFYYFSFPETVRLIQGEGDDECSVEFDVKTTEDHLTLYFMGEEYLSLDK